MNLAPYRDEQAPLRQDLPGGAVLLTVPRPSTHTVALGVWLRTGSQDEPAHLGGLSHFLEHMVFKGTATRSAFELAATFDSLGAAVDAFTTKDVVAFTVRVLPEYFAATIEVLADMLLRPAFEERLTRLEQGVVCEEIQEAFDTPEDRLHDAFSSRLYGGHQRGRPILGRPETVRTFDPDLLHREHRRLFAGPNLVISLAGNVQAGFAEHVAGLFGRDGDPAPAAAPAADTAAGQPVDPVPDDPAERLELTGPVVQTYFELGNRAISLHHPDRIPLFILSNLLGGGMSSRVFQAVREREGLAYTVYNYTDMGREVGLVSCAGSCSPEKLPRLEEVLRHEYARLIRDGVTDEELENNRAQIKSQLVFGLEGVVNQMFRSARNEIHYGRFVPVTELVEQVDGVDVATLQRVAAEWFRPDDLVVATHGPARTSA